MSKTVKFEIEVGAAMIDQLNTVLEVAKIMGTTFWALEQLKQQAEHRLACDGTCGYNNCNVRIKWLGERRDYHLDEYLTTGNEDSLDLSRRFNTLIEDILLSNESN